MTERLTCDASVLVAMLVDDGSTGRWAAGLLSESGGLVAPHLMPFEVANVLRRHRLAGLITADQATRAHADLLDLQVDIWPYELLAVRSWELRMSLSIYDASYVALAETTQTTLATLDRRLAWSPGLRCAVATPAGV